jgi:hypothetical protein
MTMTSGQPLLRGPQRSARVSPLRGRPLRRTIAGLLGTALLLGTTGLVAAGELAPWQTDPRFGAKRDAFGPGVHMDATGGVYRDSLPDAWLFPPVIHDGYGAGVDRDGLGRPVVPERFDGVGDE